MTRFFGVEIQGSSAYRCMHRTVVRRPRLNGSGCVAGIEKAGFVE